MKNTFNNLTKGYYYINSSITEANFPIPKDLSIEGYKIIKMDKSFSSQRALDEIKNQGCRPATIWEVALLKQEHSELWPKGQWSSLLAFGNIWKDADGRRRVPYVPAYAVGDFRFNLGYFEDGWDAGHCLLCFCDNQPLETQALKEDLEPLDTFPETPQEVVIEIKGQEGPMKISFNRTITMDMAGKIISYIGRTEEEY